MQTDIQLHTVTDAPLISHIDSSQGFQTALIKHQHRESNAPPANKITPSPRISHPVTAPCNFLEFQSPIVDFSELRR